MPEDVFAPDPDPNVPTSSGDMFITPTPRPALTEEQQAALQANLAAPAPGPARAPIAPPSGMGGVAAPDMGPAYRAAFSHLPVDQASKAIEAAIQYQGVRGYQRDLAAGVPAAQAFSKWGPMLFHRNAAGLSTAMRLAQPQQTPRVFPQGTAFGDKFYPTRPAPTITPYQRETLDLRKAAAEKAKKATVTVPLDANNPNGAHISGPADDPDVMAAMKRNEEEGIPPAPAPKPGILSRIFGGSTPLGNRPAPVVAPVQPATNEVVRHTKDGRRAVFDANTKKFIRYAE